MAHKNEMAVRLYGDSPQIEANFGLDPLTCRKITAIVIYCGNIEYYLERAIWRINNIDHGVKKSNEQNLLIAQRVVSTLDDLDVYLESIEDSTDDMETKIEEIESHLNEIKESIGDKGYSDDSLIDSVNKIRREID